MQTSDLRCQFQSASEKNQLKLIPELVARGEPGLSILMDFLQSKPKESFDLVIARIYQTLYQIEQPQVREFLQAEFPQGIVPLKSERQIDYFPLQKLLAQQDFARADVMTLQKLCELAGQSAVQRKWLYFTEVERFPAVDLKTIDRLWLAHSQGKFGFSVQRRIWLSLGKDWNKLWSKIGWKNGNNWTRYPNEFIWELSAPLGHLPTSNQLRGAKVITSLFSHPAWSQEKN